MEINIGKNSIRKIQKRPPKLAIIDSPISI